VTISYSETLIRGKSKLDGLPREGQLIWAQQIVCRNRVYCEVKQIRLEKSRFQRILAAMLERGLFENL